MACHARSALSIVVLLLAATAVASGETGTTAIPDNARATPIGGWECPRGFTMDEQGCAAVKVPPHAYLDTSGADWACDRGYTRTDQSCTAVKLPANAHADDELFGDGWKCDRGYRSENIGTCARIILPANAFLVDSSDPSSSDVLDRGWACDRGYYAKGDKCVAIKVPNRGYLVSTGHDWQCERGFMKGASNTCIAVQVPPNAYLDAQGDGWKCERGFQQHVASCASLVIPAHAYIDSSGNDWACEDGFYRKEKSCLPD